MLIVKVDQVHIGLHNVNIAIYAYPYQRAVLTILLLVLIRLICD